MRVVNLAKRPFVNRRPIVRLAMLLWLFGAVLLGVNATLYSEHWQGTAENRRRIAQIDDELRNQRETLQALDQELGQVRFQSRNRRAAFLNSIIARRTFPWSALFDHLERVMPDDVRLVAVQPDVQLAAQDSDDAQEARRSKEEPPPSDAVVLTLSGWAKSESALTTFVDTLYQDPAFNNPFLQGEQLDRDGNTQAVRFNLSVLFYTRPPQEEPEVDVEAEDEATLAESERPEAEEEIATGDGPETEEEAAREEEARRLARAEPSAAPPASALPDGAPEDDEQSAASRAAPSQTRTTGEPSRSQAARRDAREEAEAARARNVARQGGGTPPPNQRRPVTNREDLRQRLLELQSRSRARSDNREERRNPTNTENPRENIPPGEDESPTNTKPPASSTPRLDGVTWAPATTLWASERLEDRA